MKTNMDQENRVVVLIDMDCFYCQVEEKLEPELKGKPIAVVQYNPWKGGGIIAVNYVARARGVTRHMRGDEAKAKCPEIQLPSVPCQRGKADITKYRDAGKEVARVLQRFTALLERASIDEAYLDITAPVQERLKTLNTNMVSTALIPNTHALGYDAIEEFISDVQACGGDSIDFDHEHARRLLVGAVVVSEIRAAVFEETGYTCSAGIAHNKILAKLVCGMNKPNKQTVLPKHSINILYKTLSIKKVKHLGGKFGDNVCEVLGIDNMAELQRFTERELQAKFDEKNGTWLYNISRGVDLEPVQARFNPKSIGCCKQLRGKSAVLDLESLRRWLRDLGDEIEDRLEKDALENNRTPRQMVVSFSTQLSRGRDMSSSRSYNFAPDDELCGEVVSAKALELVLDSTEGVKSKDVEPNRKLKATITFLGISVGKFEDNSESKKTKKILDYFAAGTSNVTKAKDDFKQDKKDVKIDKKNDGKEYLMQKFFQVTDKTQDTEPKIKEDMVQEVRKDTKTLAAVAVIESTLAKQESFFAKFLNGGRNKQSTAPEELDHLPMISKDKTEDKTDPLRPSTPVCNVVNCGEDSNDTEYSGSTINMEINKSIALFEDNPEDVARITNIRELLKPTAKEDEMEEIVQTEVETTDTKVTFSDSKVRNPSPNNVGSIECPECKKIITMDMFETHSDYHLALELREEERLRVRREIQDKRSNSRKEDTPKEPLKRRKAIDDQKNETLTSIASFLVKLDETVPTQVCLECGRKVAVGKFAEHLDFHEAQKLSRQLNKKPTPNSFTDSSVKRKRKIVSPVKKPKIARDSKSIDSFFK